MSFWNQRTFDFDFSRKNIAGFAKLSRIPHWGILVFVLTLNWESFIQLHQMTLFESQTYSIKKSHFYITDSRKNMTLIKQSFWLCVRVIWELLLFKVKNTLVYFSVQAKIISKPCVVLTLNVKSSKPYSYWGGQIGPRHFKVSITFDLLVRLSWNFVTFPNFYRSLSKCKNNFVDPAHLCWGSKFLVPEWKFLSPSFSYLERGNIKNLHVVSEYHLKSPKRLFYFLQAPSKSF